MGVQEELEASIRSHFDAGELERAATVALEGYGRELLGYLVATTRDEDDATEIFAQLSEDLWRGLPRFSWRCSFRTWAYALARNAAASFHRSPHNQGRRRVPLSKISEIADRVRTQTLPHLRTDMKDAFLEIRRGLEPDDQQLLILRVNRGLSWKEIGIVLDGLEPDDDAALTRASARFRQRFQTVKRLIRQSAEERGLLGTEP